MSKRRKHFRLETEHWIAGPFLPLFSVFINSSRPQDICKVTANPQVCICVMPNTNTKAVKPTIKLIYC